jgi:deazaflavin-dependent oxidoreductase (nitroreductase family)
MATPSSNVPFQKPTALESAFNKLFGILIGLGLPMKHKYLLEVRGRKSGKLYSMPVNLLTIGGKQFLVAPRGQTQWVRNVEVAGEISLKKGGSRQSFRVRPVSDEQKPPLLKAYLEAFKSEVQRYFPVKAGSDVGEFRAIAGTYPVFELTPAALPR